MCIYSINLAEVYKLDLTVGYLNILNIRSMAEYWLDEHKSELLGYSISTTILKTVVIPNSLTSIASNAFTNCTSLEFVILENDFNCNGLDLSASNKYSKETIVAMLNALADRTNETAYFTGLEGAYVNKQLNSRIGIIGIIKKISYLGLVAVGMVIDYVIKSALTQIGVNIDFGYCIGMLIVIWLIINELISILENLAEIGVPLPKFITKIVDRLKNTIEDKAE